MVLRLVETKAMASISSRAEAIKKHNNGNHLVRIAIVCVLIFLTVQIFTKSNTGKKEEKRVTFSNPLLVSSVGSMYPSTCLTCHT